MISHFCHSLLTDSSHDSQNYSPRSKALMSPALLKTLRVSLACGIKGKVTLSWNWKLPTNGLSQPFGGCAASFSCSTVYHNCLPLPWSPSRFLRPDSVIFCALSSFLCNRVVVSPAWPLLAVLAHILLTFPWCLRFPWLMPYPLYGHPWTSFPVLR